MCCRGYVYPLLKRVELGTSIGNGPQFDRSGSTRRVDETYNRGRLREITARVECGQDRFAWPARKVCRSSNACACTAIEVRRHSQRLKEMNSSTAPGFVGGYQASRAGKVASGYVF
jgi:hypothetical protein